MNEQWRSFITAKGAQIDETGLRHFSDPAKELADIAAGSAVAELSWLGVVSVSGPDAEDFLQNQLCNDLRDLRKEKAQLNGHLNPKGRMLANFLALRGDKEISFVMPASLIPSFIKRLSMYRLRAKVDLADSSDQWVAMGLVGAEAEAALGTEVSEKPFTVVAGEHGIAIRLPQAGILLLAPAAKAQTLWEGFAARCPAVGGDAWQWLLVQAGLPIILPATQEKFVPQMVNYEALGGVSFTKGCFPGQEVVARTQHLGEIKRRLHLAHLDAPEVPVPGDELHGGEAEAQVGGQIVNCCPAPGGGYDLLAVIPKASVGNPIHWKSANGPQLVFKALPYTVS